ncbi:MAG: DUF6139 family protein [Pseudomonadota bacterium]
MRLNIFRRAEADGRFSFLAVPDGHLIPDEVTSTDWQFEAGAVEVDDAVDQLPEFSIDHVTEQIGEKGYAMTAVIPLRALH